jgi:hypothetical protein
VDKADILVQGYHTAGYGGGVFSWDAASTAADDGGLVIQPTDHSAPGRWIRNIDGNGRVRSKWFGARGDAVTDDSLALQNGIDVAKARGMGFELDIGDYVTGPLKGNGSTWQPTDIAGQQAAVLCFVGNGRSPFLCRLIAKAGAYAADEAVITFRNVSGVTVGNFQVDAANVADVACDFAWIGTASGVPGTEAPTCENEFSSIWANNANKLGVNLDQAADCLIQSIHYRGGTAPIGVSMQLGGGWIGADNLVVATGRFRVACQNAGIQNSVFFSGIEISGAALDHIHFDACHLYPFTPRRTLLADPFTTTNGSAIVTVSMPAHGLVNGNYVELAGCVDTNGILAAQLNTTAATPRAITYIDADSFSIVAGTEATCTLTVTSTSNPETITALTVDGVSLIPGTQSYGASATSNEIAASLASVIAAYSATSDYTATALNNVITVSGVLRRASANGDVIASSTTGGLSLVSGVFAGGVDAPASSSGTAGGTTVAITGRGWSVYSSATTGTGPRSLEMTACWLNVLGVTGQKHFSGRWLNGARFRGCRFGNNLGEPAATDIYFDAANWTPAGGSSTLPLFFFDNCGFSVGRPVSVASKVLVGFSGSYNGADNTSRQDFEWPGALNLLRNAFDVPAQLGSLHVWNDTANHIRTKASAPASATDGNMLVERQSGVASPQSSVTPSHSGCVFTDGATGRVYLAYNTTNTSWLEPVRLRTGAATPVGFNTPTRVGEILVDTTNDKVYIAKDLTNADWIELTAVAGSYQPIDSDLTAIAALTSAADQMPYATGAGTWAMTTVTAAARTLLDDTTTALMLATLGGMPLAGGNFTGLVTQSAGNGLVVGGTALVAGVYSGSAITPQIQVQAAGASSVATFRAGASASPNFIGAFKTRGASASAHTTLNTNDQMLAIVAGGSDGTAYRDGLRIIATVTGAPTATNVPTRVDFLTGDGTSAFVGLGQDQNGNLQVNSATVVTQARHFRPRQYTVATLPSAATAGEIIWVADGTGNNRVATSNGANWVWMNTNTVVS